MKPGIKTRRQLFINIATICAYLGILALMYFLNIPCVFKTVLGIPCPGCGMTHALLHASKLELAEAFRCHAMFWSVPIVFAALFLPPMLLRTRPVRAALIAIAVGFIANWIHQIATF